MTDYRDILQRLIYAVIDPLLRLLIRLHVTPNMVTVAGLVGNMVAAWFFLRAAMTADAEGTAREVLWGGCVILLAGLTDMMDGRLARLSGRSTTFGALLDSTLDRYSELFTLSGIALLFLHSGTDWLWAGIVTLAAVCGSMMVSYVRARAEGLGIECKVGLMQRPERVVVTAVTAIVSGLTANMMWMAGGMVLIAVLANATALWRIVHCYNTMKRRDAKDGTL